MGIISSTFAEPWEFKIIYMKVGGKQELFECCAFSWNHVEELKQGWSYYEIYCAALKYYT